MSEAGRTEDLEARLAALEQDPMAVARRARADAELRRIGQEHDAAADELARLEGQLAEIEETELPRARGAAEEAGAALREAEEARNAAEDRVRRLSERAGLLGESARGVRNRLSGLDESAHALRTGGVA